MQNLFTSPHSHRYYQCSQKHYHSWGTLWHQGFIHDQHLFIGLHTLIHTQCKLFLQNFTRKQKKLLHPLGTWTSHPHQQWQCYQAYPEEFFKPVSSSWTKFLPITSPSPTSHLTTTCIQVNHVILLNSPVYYWKPLLFYQMVFLSPRLATITPPFPPSNPLVPHCGLLNALSDKTHLHFFNASLVKILPLKPV